MPFSDWNTDPTLNTTVGGVAIGPGMPVSNTNKAFSAVMAELADDANARGALLTDAGALGDGSDQTVAVQALLTGNKGGVDIPVGVFTTGQMFITEATHIRGRQTTRSVLKPRETMNPSLAYLIFAHRAGDFTDYSGLERVFIGNPNNGTRAGGIGILVDTRGSKSQAARFTMRDVMMNPNQDYAVVFINDPNADTSDAHVNYNGGVFTGLIDNCTLPGLKFEKSGDSYMIRGGTFTNPNPGIAGINIDIVNTVGGGRGACWVIDGANSRSAGGALRVVSASRLDIRNVNFEHTTAGSADNGFNVALIGGVAGDVSGGGSWEGGLCLNFGTSDATTLIRLSGRRGFKIDRVQLNTDKPNVTGISIDAACENTVIGRIAFGAALATRVLDNGKGTMGIEKIPAVDAFGGTALGNGWTHHADGGVRFIKHPNGMVHITGQATGGTTTAGTLLFTLPQGFRGAAGAKSRLPLECFNGTVSTAGWAEVNHDTGAVIIVGAQANRTAFMGGSFYSSPHWAE